MLLGSGEELEEGDEYDDVDFPKLLQDNVNGTITLLVWNIKAQEKRIVDLIPRTDWGGAGLLGVTIKLDNYGGADEHLIRVLEVDTNDSPAKLAGLIPNEDYLLGTTGTALSDTDVLATVLQMHINKVVELYVYNSVTDLVRIVGLHPTYRWGDGYSLFGAAVGQGYLHRLPKSCRNTMGKSIERTVSVHNRDQSLSDSNIVHEPTLEMEVDDDDDDVGLAAKTPNNSNSNTNHRSREVQPHQLGSPIKTRLATAEQTPAGSTLSERNDISSSSSSMRSIPFETLPASIATATTAPPMEAFQQQPPQQQRQDPTEQHEGRPQTPPRATAETKTAAARPDPPSSPKNNSNITSSSTQDQQQQQQQQQQQEQQRDPTPKQNDRPSFKEKLFNYVAPIPDRNKPESVAAPPPTPLQPSSLSSSEFSTPHPQRPTMATTNTATTLDSSSPRPHLTKTTPPCQLKIASPFPDAAPIVPMVLPPPSPSAVSAPLPPPPPSVVDPQSSVPPPPPPPLPPPPLPPSLVSPAAPEANKNIRDASFNSSSHCDDNDEDDGSEYTDDSASYTDGEYTDDEEGEESHKKTSGGLFSAFMPAPPKMEY